jgi:GDPmannose 4,6-dehydratase
MMHLMLQQDQPEDFVIATGRTHSIRRLCEIAFACVDLDWQRYVYVDEAFLRPADVDLLIGDATKAKQKLGWQPSITFEEMIQKMVEADLAALKKQYHL